MRSATMKEALGLGAGAFGAGAFGARVLSRPRGFLPQNLVLSRPTGFLTQRLVLSCPRARVGLTTQHSSRRIIPRSSTEHIDFDYASSQTSLYAIHQNGYVVFGSDSRIGFPYEDYKDAKVIPSVADGAICSNSYVKRFRIFDDAVVGCAGSIALSERLRIAVDSNRHLLGNPKTMAGIADFVCFLLNQILKSIRQDVRDSFGVRSMFIVAGRCKSDMDILVVQRDYGLPFFITSGGREAMAGGGTEAMREYVRRNPLPVDAHELRCALHVYGAIYAATLEDPGTGGTIRVSVAGEHGGWGEYLWPKDEDEDGTYTGPYGPFPEDYDEGLGFYVLYDLIE